MTGSKVDHLGTHHSEDLDIYEGHPLNDQVACEDEITLYYDLKSKKFTKGLPTSLPGPEADYKRIDYKLHVYL